MECEYLNIFYLNNDLNSYPNSLHVFFLRRKGLTNTLSIHPFKNIPNTFWRWNDVEGWWNLILKTIVDSKKKYDIGSKIQTVPPSSK